MTVSPSLQIGLEEKDKWLGSSWILRRTEMPIFIFKGMTRPNLRPGDPFHNVLCWIVPDLEYVFFAVFYEAFFEAFFLTCACDFEA